MFVLFYNHSSVTTSQKQIMITLCLLTIRLLFTKFGEERIYLTTPLISKSEGSFFTFSKENDTYLGMGPLT